MADDNRIISMDRELYEYKRKVIQKFLDCDAIVEAINAEELDASELVYHNIFPFGVILETQTDAKTIITVEVTMPQVSTVNYFFKDVLLVVNVICHQDLMRTDYGVPRHDYISKLICEILNGSTDFGYGEVSLVSNTENAFSERHAGRTMRFQTKEQTKNNLCV